MATGSLAEMVKPRAHARAGIGVPVVFSWRLRSEGNCDRSVLLAAC